LVRVPQLYGIQANGGVYGVHSWKTSQLGLNYAGSYTSTSIMTPITAPIMLSLGYTDQFRRLRLDLNESAEASLTVLARWQTPRPDLNSSFTPSVRLFDTPPTSSSRRCRNLFTIARVLYTGASGSSEPEVRGLSMGGATI
jgi:hypothetical protein